MIHRIIQRLDSGLTLEERDMCLHLLFQEEKGMQFFVAAAATMKKIPPLILTFLSFLLEYYSICLESYITTIKDIALSFIKRESASADEKDKALDVMIAIVQKGPWSADLEIQTLVIQLCRMSSSKVSKPTVLRKVYSLVGAIAEHMPHDIQFRADRLQSAILSDLQYQTTTASNVQFPVIEGCFEGLSGFLYDFPLEGVAGVERCKKITECLMKVLERQDTRKRVAARAALKVLSRHGDQFQVTLVPNFRKWHDDILIKWLASSREERPIAKQALLTFYNVMANHASMVNPSLEAVKGYNFN